MGQPEPAHDDWVLALKVIVNRLGIMLAPKPIWSFKQSHLKESPRLASF